MFLVHSAGKVLYLGEDSQVAMTTFFGAKNQGTQLLNLDEPQLSEELRSLGYQWPAENHGSTSSAKKAAEADEFFVREELETFRKEVADFGQETYRHLQEVGSEAAKAVKEAMKTVDEAFDKVFKKNQKK